MICPSTLLAVDVSNINQTETCYKNYTRGVWSVAVCFLILCVWREGGGGGSFFVFYLWFPVPLVVIKFETTSKAFTFKKRDRKIYFYRRKIATKKKSTYHWTIKISKKRIKKVKTPLYCLFVQRNFKILRKRENERECDKLSKSKI